MDLERRTKTTKSDPLKLVAYRLRLSETERIDRLAQRLGCSKTAILRWGIELVEREVNSDSDSPN